MEVKEGLVLYAIKALKDAAMSYGHPQAGGDERESMYECEARLIDLLQPFFKSDKQEEFVRKETANEQLLESMRQTNAALVKKLSRYEDTSSWKPDLTHCNPPAPDVQKAGV